MRKILMLFVILLTVGFTAGAQEDGFVFGDALPDAPELAQRGPFQVGVRMLSLVDAGRVDILSASSANPSPLYDRPLDVIVWYPAALGADETEYVEYAETLGRTDIPSDPLTPFTFAGRAAQDAAPDASAAPYPLVIVSHGYPGSPLMMTNLTENLASKGYVVVAIAHTDSTFSDVGAFSSTLVNRPLDQWFVLNEMARLSAEDGDFLTGMVDADNTAIIGYSMGGYGALNVLGAGYNGFAANFGPGVNLAPLVEGNEAYAALYDDRVKAAVLLAPWGGSLRGVGLGDLTLWNESALGNISAPTLWLVGSQDDIAIFSGVRRLFDWAVNSERHMLVYENALHNIGPNPPPVEAVTLDQYARYSDPVWDIRRVNNINQHFITAFLGLHLQGQAEYADYLNVAVENAGDGVYATDESGAFTSRHTYWPGFAARTAQGLRLIAGARADTD